MARESGQEEVVLCHPYACVKPRSRNILHGAHSYNGRMPTTGACSPTSLPAFAFFRAGLAANCFVRSHEMHAASVRPRVASLPAGVLASSPTVERIYSINSIYRIIKGVKGGGNEEEVS